MVQGTTDRNDVYQKVDFWIIIHETYPKVFKEKSAVDLLIHRGILDIVKWIWICIINIQVDQFYQCPFRASMNLFERSPVLWFMCFLVSLILWLCSFVLFILSCRHCLCSIWVLSATPLSPIVASCDDRETYLSIGSSMTVWNLPRSASGPSPTSM